MCRLNLFNLLAPIKPNVKTKAPTSINDCSVRLHYKILKKRMSKK